MSSCLDVWEKLSGDYLDTIWRLSGGYLDLSGEHASVSGEASDLSGDHLEEDASDANLMYRYHIPNMIIETVHTTPL